MPRASSTFKQNDVTKIIKAVVAGGGKVASVEMDPTGKIIVIAENGDRQPVKKTVNENEWDKIT
jgi:hypothetical protein